MERTTIGRVLADLETLRDLPDFTAPGILNVPDSLKIVLRWMLQQRAVTCGQFARFFQVSEESVQSLVRHLSDRGLIEHVPTCGEPVYRVSCIPPFLRPPLEVLRKLE